MTLTGDLYPSPGICQKMMVANVSSRAMNAYIKRSDHSTAVHYRQIPVVVYGSHDVCSLFHAPPSLDRQILSSDWTITRNLAFLAFGGRNATGLRG